MKTSNIFINFYNCVLQGNGGATSTVAGWLYDYNSSNVIITLFNCYIDTYGNCLFRGYNQPKCVNCVVVSVSQSTLSFGNAPITETCIFDKKKDIYIDYTIKSNLLNMGNGKNPDGTIANIGVYGEQYAWGDWKIHLYLIKQDDQYYSITSEYYKNGQYIPLSLSGGEQPNDDDYNNYGFDDIGDLCKTYDTEIHEADGESLGDGKMFTFDIPNDIKNINNIE